MSLRRGYLLCPDGNGYQRPYVLLNFSVLYGRCCLRLKTKRLAGSAGRFLLMIYLASRIFGVSDVFTILADG